jgi:hypothetical protein
LKNIKKLAGQSEAFLMILANEFKNLATGTIQAPKIPVTGNLSFLSSNSDLLKYHNLLVKNMGPAFEHFCASIPFVIEELCRIGITLSNLTKEQSRNCHEHFTFYEMAAFDGAYARTLAEHSNGLIRTLTNSPTSLNEYHFNRLSRHNFSKFHVGSFMDITFDYLASQPDLQIFQNGFDFIYERAAFQFYSSDRISQIGSVARLLKENGLMICLEKLSHLDSEEYKKRELVKDKLYKSIYFSDEEIEWKRLNMLKDMEKHGQVHFGTLVDALSRHFKFAYLVWNSTNFYEFVASNNEFVIEKFMALLTTPYIPPPFCFEKQVTRRLFP